MTDTEQDMVSRTKTSKSAILQNSGFSYTPPTLNSPVIIRIVGVSITIDASVIFGIDLKVSITPCSTIICINSQTTSATLTSRSTTSNIRTSVVVTNQVSVSKIASSIYRFGFISCLKVKQTNNFVAITLTSQYRVTRRIARNSIDFKSNNITSKTYFVGRPSYLSDGHFPKTVHHVLLLLLSTYCCNLCYNFCTLSYMYYQM